MDESWLLCCWLFVNRYVLFDESLYSDTLLRSVRQRRDYNDRDDITCSKQIITSRNNMQKKKTAFNHTGICFGLLKPLLKSRFQHLSLEIKFLSGDI